MLRIRCHRCVKVVSCTLLRLSQVGRELIDAVAQSFILLMQSSLRAKEVVLGDVDVWVIILLDEEWVRRGSWPIHHLKQICEWKEEKN